MTTETLNEISKSHFFYYEEAAKALGEMFAASFDLHSDKFTKAKERFDLAVKRANQEKAKLENLE